MNRAGFKTTCEYIQTTKPKESGKRCSSVLLFWLACFCSEQWDWKCCLATSLNQYLVWAWCLVHSARVFIMLLGFCLVCHAVWLVHWRHVVHQGDGLHSFVDSAADGLADLGGCWSSGGWKVMAGLKPNKSPWFSLSNSLKLQRV